MSRRSRNKQSSDEALGQKDAARKPRIVIAGEFSAGKTRLISGLIGQDVLPSNVVATALPPIWLVHGPERMAAVSVDGEVRDLETLDGVSVEDTTYCVVSHPAEILKTFEIIDTPGSSDPSIPAECWERVLQFADFALWCTNATQAWRQSEKSVWDDFPEHLVGPAMLLVSHADRMPDDRTAERVMRRVRRETKPYFSHYEMASLIRSDDVTRVSDYLQQIATDGIAPMGADDPALESIIARWASEPAPLRPKAAPSHHVTPRRVVRKTNGAEQNDREHAKSAEVLHLNSEPQVHEPAVKEGTMRIAWAEMLAEVDTEDPGAILDCADRFISLLEKNGDQYLVGNDLSQEDAFTAGKKSRVTGS